MIGSAPTTRHRPGKTWRRFRQTTIAAAALVMAVQATAQQRVPPDMATTSQKATFVTNLVTDSVTADKIESSGDAQAMDRLEEARALVDQAKADLGRQDAAAADAKLDKALALVNTEAKRLSGTDVRDEHQKEIYERRLASVSAFLGAYERVAEDEGSASASRQASEIRGLMDKARAAAKAGDYPDAIADLDRAYAIARGDLRSMREGQTLTRSLDFKTAEEEYEYELGRNRSHFLLLEFAIKEKSPQGSVVGRIEQNRSKATQMRAEAEDAAAKGDHPDAIKKLNASTELLLKSIRMSGMFIPG